MKYAVSVTSRTSRAALLAGAAASSVWLADGPARACGGCFNLKTAGTETTVVTDHRMAFSLSKSQTVLWDQIKYAGNPSEFSWVLPVRPGTVIQESRDEFFAALDAVTSPTITGPVRNCNQGAGQFSCGSSSSALASFGGSGNGGVQVISQSVVGPYDTVTLASTDPTALTSWLDLHGYAIPGTFRPTIAAYVNEHFDFIALRLQPGKGVQAMEPVRVVFQGADASLPLRMVAAGVGAQVGITLYVIGEGRYEARSPYFNAVVDDSQLVWFQAQTRSNFQELEQGLMQSHNSRTWVTEYASPTALQAGVTSCGNSQGYCGALVSTYTQSCQSQGLNRCDAQALVLEQDAGVGTDAGEDAGAESGTGTGMGGGTVCVANPCDAFDDLNVALVGMNPQSTWVTRLRAVLPANALSEGDLDVQASTSQTPVSNQHSVNLYSDPLYSPCGNKGGCSASAEGDARLERWLVLGAFTFAAAMLVRRRTKENLNRERRREGG